jgi:hypothetical protein
MPVLWYWETKSFIQVHRHNCRIWGSQFPHRVSEYERDSPRFRVWCHEVSRPLFSQEKIMNSINVLDMLELFSVPQLAYLQSNVSLQQDGAPPHRGLTVRESLNTSFPNRWFGREGPTLWPSQSPDITSLDFLLGLCKGPDIPSKRW